MRTEPRSRPGRPAAARLGRRTGGWGTAAIVGLAVSAGALLLYLPIYEARDFALPLGWDTPWYVYRADVVAALGIGAVDTEVRPGHPILTALLGAVTGLTALQMQAVLPYVLVAGFALAVGGTTAAAVGREEPWRVALAAAVTGVVLGATRLVGENVANLLHLLLVVPAFLLVGRFAADGAAGRVPALFGAALLLVAAGLSHWVFLGVVGIAMALWAILALPGSLRARRTGVRLWRTESGALAVTGAAAGAVMGVLIYPVLGSSFRVREIGESPTRFLPKLTEDLGAMWAPAVAPVAGAGGVALARGERGGRARPTRGPFLRMLAAWTVVCLAGLGFSAASLDLPPHRFLMLLTAVPVTVALAAAVWTAAGWVAGRAGRAVAVATAVVAVGLLAVPGLLWWYGPADLRGPEQWFDPQAFDQAGHAAAYVEDLPAGRPVVFLVGARGSSGVVSAALKERTIRAALPPERQDDLFFFPGRPADLLAGRLTAVPDRALREHNDPYAREALAVLGPRTPVIVLEALGPEEYRASMALHAATELDPGVALLRGPRPAGSPEVEAIDAVPPLPLGLAEGMGLMVLLVAAGAGWARWFLGPDAAPITVLALAPAAGAGMLVLVGFVPALAGLGLDGPAGILSFGAAAGAGLLLGAGGVSRAEGPRAAP